LELLLQDPDDLFVSKELPEYIRTYPLTAPLTILEHAQVLTRLCAMSDAPFIQTVLTLARATHVGQMTLFLQPVMERIAALAYHQYQGEFLRGARSLPDFDAANYRRELRPYLLRHSAQQGVQRVWAPMTGQALLAKNIPDLEFIVDEILPVGATLFVGRAKDGKSLAMWNLCLAVAGGGVVFGRYPTTPGPVLYLALEDGERRAKKRLSDQLRALHMDTCPENFELICWDAPRVGEGLEEKLHNWLDAHLGAKLVVIDILEKIRPPRTRNGSVYADDYAAVAPLQRLAQDRGIAIVIVHHTHKAKAEDFRDAPSGSNSLLGAVDTLWSLRRVAGETDAVLQITGREVLENAELAMEFRDGFWTARGDAATTILNPAHQAIVDTLRTAGYPMTPTQLATVLGANLNTVKVHLMRLTERGLVTKDGQGRYMHSITTPEVLEAVTHCNPGTQEPQPAVGPERDTMPPSMPDLPVIEGSEDVQTPVQDTAVDEDVAMDEEPVAETVTPVTGDAPLTTATMNGQYNGNHNSHTKRTTVIASTPQFCPGCGAMTTWIDRGTYIQCSNRPCGWKVLK
jgi:DNA-binding transcriptional ArsR family regulator